MDDRLNNLDPETLKKVLEQAEKTDETYRKFLVTLKDKSDKDKMYFPLLYFIQRLNKIADQNRDLNSQLWLSLIGELANTETVLRAILGISKDQDISKGI